ncbi:hypothetical protein O2N63_16635 [Aliiroseovarius sp. KMU-50]|uniref:Uncharacterized protein n=1 Tax=Aliiroseovarius salicola TaxID=3009082 RepID=A0ABT4W5G5_9RHOB|nr:hypothetical protein [Aliiroseovarius sp. KMU-50]MDA5095720.1 hypothetical protein [Aliiroseovarius sp. KMU-50]
MEFLLLRIMATEIYDNQPGAVLPQVLGARSNWHWRGRAAAQDLGLI